MQEATDSDYLDAFRRRLLDPEECVARWERHHDLAYANMRVFTDAHALAARLGEQVDPRFDGACEAAKMTLATTFRELRAARRRLAKYREHNVADNPPAAPPPAPREPRARARGRRARRRVTRPTSSSDDPPRPPARGLATCPLCCDEAIVRTGCRLCGGLGFVGRELRSRWKRGER